MPKGSLRTAFRGPPTGIWSKGCKKTATLRVVALLSDRLHFLPDASRWWLAVRESYAPLQIWRGTENRDICFYNWCAEPSCSVPFGDCCSQ